MSTTSSQSISSLDDSSTGSFLHSKIAYLGEKQQLLRRACRVMQEEDNYHAAEAWQLVMAPEEEIETDASLSPDDDDDDKDDEVYDYDIQNGKNIWKQAQKILVLLGETPTVFAPQVAKQQWKAIAQSNSIDIRCVHRIRSTFANESTIPRQLLPTCLSTSIVPVIGTENLWLARALAWNQHYKICSDPFTRTSLGLIPPVITRYRRLHRALAVTHWAKLVTQATPPFAVVHVNRACLQQVSSVAIMGQPLASVLICVTGASSSNAGERWFNCMLVDQACRMEWWPVVDASNTYVSHILIHIRFQRRKRIS